LIPVSVRKLEAPVLYKLGILKEVAVYACKKPILHIYINFFGALGKLCKCDTLLNLLEFFTTIYQKIREVLARVRSFDQ
jgi:hypothetical protein